MENSKKTLFLGSNVDECPLCGGTEWIARFDEQGRTFAAPCECREKNYMRRKLEFANLPPAYSDVTMENFRQDVYQRQESKKIIYAAGKAVSYYLQNAEEFLAKGTGLYLYSRAKGSGKTRLIASIANELIKDHQVRFATSMNILEKIKESWNQDKHERNKYYESQLLHDLTTVEILIIDDFGTEGYADWIDGKYYQIINQRYINKKATFFTANYRIEDLPYDERICSRVKECCFQIAFPEESVREYIAMENNKKMMKDVFAK